MWPQTFTFAMGRLLPAKSPKQIGHDGVSCNSSLVNLTTWRAFFISLGDTASDVTSMPLRNISLSKVMTPNMLTQKNIEAAALNMM
mmetsp:Transcript_53152/g.147156  ORF Transcript_53152/g.147156 Transcript_53152/m.147156 type:complete len:86 (-) Transcript_53152:550-807(-)